MSKILFVASEVQPLIKTGGLADVAGALPVALKQLKNTVRILLPAYRDVLDKGLKTKELSRIYIPGTAGQLRFLEAQLPESRIKLILVDYPPAFDRPGNPYMGENGQPWPDNAERFALLCRAATAVAMDQAGLNWQPDVVHCNDWQTGLVPALLSTALQAPKTVFTIHNLAYQGLFPWNTFLALGLDPEFWQPYRLEFHNQLSFIKGGLIYADQITTVSPKYAQEIQTWEFGCGLEGLLSHRKDQLSGIINGIDQSVWNPQTDPLIKHHYHIDDCSNKNLNKADLQKEFGLPLNPNDLLLGFIGRLVDQKGIDLICQIAPKLLAYPIQLVVLGTGDVNHENQLQQLAQKYPNGMAVKIGYDESLAHKIEAGSDAFLMPSRFEPCGLNQLYSLRYGTLPIVNNVGGLSNTVVDKNSEGLQKTGFVFNETSAEALQKTVLEAFDLYRQPAKWKKIMRAAMQQDFSWNQSASQYHGLYKNLLRPPKRISKSKGLPKKKDSKVKNQTVQATQSANDTLKLNNSSSN